MFLTMEQDTQNGIIHILLTTEGQKNLAQVLAIIKLPICSQVKIVGTIIKNVQYMRLEQVNGLPIMERKTMVKFMSMK